MAEVIPWRKPSSPDDDWDDDPEPRCPACGSMRIVTYHPFAFWILMPVILPVLVFTIVLLPLVPLCLRLLWVKKWYCTACKHRWKHA